MISRAVLADELIWPHKRAVDLLFQKAKVLIALVVIVNPLGALPTYITLTRDYTAPQRRGTARTAAIAVAVVMVVSALVGEYILQFFSISIAAFRVGGGILILMMALSMLNARTSRAKQTPEEAAEAEDKETIGIVPLGVPLLAGPGAISTAIVYAQQAHTVVEMVYTVLCCTLVGVSVWASLRAAEPIGKALGRTGLNIASRFMGIILAALAIEIISAGARELLPGIGKVLP
jgi:multiple antibiotic resistance protein